MSLLIFSDFDGVIAKNIEKTDFPFSPDTFESEIEKIKEFFLSIEPVEDIYLLKDFLLQNLSEIKFFIVTSRPLIMYDITNEWLKKHCIPVYDVYCCGSDEQKVNFVLEHEPDFFIDDKEKVINCFKDKKLKTTCIYFKSWDLTFKLIKAKGDFYGYKF